MLDPISQSLQALLIELNLCSHRDLRRCRAHVRQLTRDLPVFDSVWLDALVRRGRLSSFQARILESGNPQQIRVGKCVLVDRLGSGPSGDTFLARLARGQELCAVKILRTPDTFSVDQIERLQTIVGKLKSFFHPSVIGPIACDRDGNAVLLFSRYIPGRPLRDLLVQRGRFPAPVVVEIARQLVDGLTALARCGMSHGDIRAGNVRMTAAGEAVLVDAGVRTSISTELTIHSRMSPDQYDGVAPELIGAAATPGRAADMYAMGCLLWQLLAGRPPFPAGDPLIKLAAHRESAIGDVRNLVPETPSELAETILRLTSRDPTERPGDFEELARTWGAPRRRGRRLLSTCLSRFDAPVSGRGHGERLALSRWSAALVALLLVSMAAVTLANAGARNIALVWTLRISNLLRGDELENGTQALRPPESAVAKTSLMDAAPLTERRLQELPAPNANGMIRLLTPGPYRAPEISNVGPLSIVAESEVQPEILIGDRPMKLLAESVRLEGVHLRRDPAREGLSPADVPLLVVQAQSLEVAGCVLQDSNFERAPSSPDGDSFVPTPGPTLIAWKLLDPRDSRGGKGMIRQSLLLGSGAAIYLAHPVRDLECVQCLKIGPGPLIHVAASPASGDAIRIRLRESTCRNSGAIVRWLPGRKEKSRGDVLVEANDCVFDLLPNRAALFEIATAIPDRDWHARVTVTGEGSLAGDSPIVGARIDPETGRLLPLDAEELSVEGLVGGPFTFVGEAGNNPASSEILSYDAPRRSTVPPGMRAEYLPTITETGARYRAAAESL